MVRLQAEGGGGLLVHQEGLRGVRRGQEVHQHGQGDGVEGVNLQQIHRSDDCIG